MKKQILALIACLMLVMSTTAQAAILSSDCEKAKTENEVLSAFLKEMQECDNVQLLWNEYWNNIIQQTPPSYYE